MTSACQRHIDTRLLTVFSQLLRDISMYLKLTGGIRVCKLP